MIAEHHGDKGSEQLDAHERRSLAEVADATIARYPRVYRIWGLSGARIERILRMTVVGLLVPQGRRG
jgi:hypothetical protein